MIGLTTFSLYDQHELLAGLLFLLFPVSVMRETASSARRDYRSASMMSCPVISCECAGSEVAHYICTCEDLGDLALVIRSRTTFCSNTSVGIWNYRAESAVASSSWSAWIGKDKYLGSQVTIHETLGSTSIIHLCRLIDLHGACRRFVTMSKKHHRS